jgi:hypothetical protein
MRCPCPRHALPNARPSAHPHRYGPCFPTHVAEAPGGVGHTQAQRGDYGYYRAGFPTFRRRTERLGARVLALANSILAHQQPAERVPRLPDLEAVQDDFADAVEALDAMLEKAVRGVPPSLYLAWLAVSCLTMAAPVSARAPWVFAPICARVCLLTIRTYGLCRFHLRMLCLCAPPPWPSAYAHLCMLPMPVPSAYAHPTAYARLPSMPMHDAFADAFAYARLCASMPFVLNSSSARFACASLGVQDAALDAMLRRGGAAVSVENPLPQSAPMVTTVRATHSPTHPTHLLLCLCHAHSPCFYQVVAAGARGGRAEYRLIHAQNILRPQLRFDPRPDNSARPWRPILTSKHHALEPFQPGNATHVPRRKRRARFPTCDRLCD